MRLGAATELLLDKAPFVGPRTSPPALLARMASGAYVASARRPRRLGGLAAAVLGAATALVSAEVTYHARRVLTARLRRTRAANVALGIAEDLLAFALGRFAGG